MVETATRVPALTELPRTVLLAVQDVDATGALREAARAEGFDVLDGGDLEEVLHIVRTQQPPIVVLEARPGRSLDELADDARELIESYPEGATIAYLTTATPPSNGIRPEITDWLVWPASLSHLRTKLRAWLMRRACRWQAAALPVDESERLAALWNLGILDSDPEGTVRPLHRGRVLDVRRPDRPRERSSMASANGSNRTPVSTSTSRPRDESMCAHAILGDDAFVITDALDDDRFADNPHVRRGARLRFYAGVPLTLVRRAPRRDALHHGSPTPRAR